MDDIENCRTKIGIHHGGRSAMYGKRIRMKEYKGKNIAPSTEKFKKPSTVFLLLAIFFVGFVVSVHLRPKAPASRFLARGTRNITLLNFTMEFQHLNIKQLDNLFSKVELNLLWTNMFTGSQGAHLMHGNIETDTMNLCKDLPRGLKIAQWNVQCITNKIDQLKTTKILRCPGTQIHILGLSEIWLNSKYAEGFAQIEGWCIFRRDRSQKEYCGLLLFVNNKIQHFR